MFLSLCVLFLQLEEDSSIKLKSRSNSFIEKLKNKRYLYPLSAGLLTSVGLYGLSKTNFPLLKNVKNLSIIKKFLLFSGIGMTAGGLFLIFKNNTGLIMRPNDHQFWLTDKDAQKYLAFRIKEKRRNIKEGKEEEESCYLSEYIKDIVAIINQQYWKDDALSDEVKKNKEMKDQQTKDFLSSCDIEKCKKYKVRIFNEYISFDDLVDFIKNVDREKLLYFLRWVSTIRHNLQGELIENELWTEASAAKLASFLAFGYYADTCGKFLYLEPDRLITFLENAVYSMYQNKDGYYEKITRNAFEKYCRLKIINIELDEKKDLTNIMIQKIKEEQSLKE